MSGLLLRIWDTVDALLPALCTGTCSMAGALVGGIAAILAAQVTAMRTSASYIGRKKLETLGGFVDEEWSPEQIEVEKREAATKPFAQPLGLGGKKHQLMRVGYYLMWMFAAALLLWGVFLALVQILK